MSQVADRAMRMELVPCCVSNLLSMYDVKAMTCSDASLFGLKPAHLRGIRGSRIAGSLMSILSRSLKRRQRRDIGL